MGLDNYLKKVKGMVKEAGEKVQPLVDEGAGALKNIANSSQSCYEKSGAKKQIDDLSEKAHKHYSESGLKDHVDSVSGNISNQFDVVSGKAMYDAVLERLALQEEYNDILASKLFEALEKIQELEKRLDG